MDDFAEPLVVLPDEAALRGALADTSWMTETYDELPSLGGKWRTKSVFLCALIDEIAARGEYPYNTSVMRLAEERLGIPRQPDNESPLSLLVYTAQGYRRADNLRAAGFQPLTPELVAQAFRSGAKIELYSAGVFGSGTTLYNVRRIGDQLYVMLPHKRKYAVRPEGQPARLVWPEGTPPPSPADTPLLELLSRS